MLDDQNRAADEAYGSIGLTSRDYRPAWFVQIEASW
jgi:hypothetical protein